jgi:hypothetical protein
MSDPFKSYATSLTGPATELHAITPNDAADLPVFARGLAVTASGLVQVTTVGGTTAAIYVVAGAPFPVRVRRVWATGTDAAGIVGLV